jgi:hypothetical protein
MKHFKVQIKEYNEQDNNEILVKEYIVKRVPRIKYREIEQLQLEILEEFFVNNLSIGTTIKDDTTWDKMCTLAKMLPVVGKAKAGFNLSEIEDDLTQLGTIFFTSAIREDNLRVTPDDVAENPSLISQLHYLDLLLPIAEMGKRIEKRLTQIMSQIQNDE